MSRSALNATPKRHCWLWNAENSPKPRLKISTDWPASTKAKGLSPATARAVAKELTAHNVFAAHVDVELGIDLDDLTNPWQAALSLAVSFTLGALLPLIAILTPPVVAQIPLTFAAALLALALTGTISARLRGADPRRAGTPHRGRRSDRDDGHLRDRTTARRGGRLKQPAGGDSRPRRASLGFAASRYRPLT
jgi:hypothetical protein